jgi:hypothetical protein
MTVPFHVDEEVMRTAIIRSELQALTEESVKMDLHREYFDGEQPLTYSTQIFHEVFGDAFEGFSDNWCKVVVNAVNDRLKLLGFNLEDDDGFERANQLWTAMKLNDIDEQQIDLHEGVLVEGQAYMIVWPGEEEGTVQLDWQPGQLVRIFYDPDNRRKPLWAVKRWATDFGETFVTFYTDEFVWKFKESSGEPDINKRSEGGPSALTEIPGIPGAFANLTPRNVPGEPHPLEHDFGRVPIVEFNNTSYRSEIKDTVPQQDAINKTLLDMMISGEYTADPQKFVETMANEPEGGWKSGPGEVWHFTPSFDAEMKQVPGQFGTFEVGTPDNFVKPVEMWLQHVALSSSTPVRYFFASDRGGRGDSPSGESLLVDDKPLNDKVAKKHTFLGNRWLEVARLVDIALGGNGDLVGEPVWEDPRHDFKMALIAEAAAMVAMGIPIEFIADRIGLTPEEVVILIELLVKAKAEEEEKAEREMVMQEQAMEAKSQEQAASSGGSDF